MKTHAKKWYRLAALLLAIVCGLAACSNTPASSAAPADPGSTPAAPVDTPEPGGDTKVLNVLWLAGMNQTNVIKEVIEEKFSEEHPDIQIVFTEAPNNEIADKAMLEATGKTGAYDVVMQNMMIPALTNIGALAPLDEFIARDNYPIEKLIDNGIYYQGHCYGVPIRGDVRVLHYNEAQFKAAGLDPEAPPATMEEFERYAEQLTRDGHFGVNRNITDADNFVSLLFQYGGDLLDEDNRPVFNGEAGMKALEVIMSQQEQGINDPNAVSWQYSDEIAGYLSGGAAMFDAWPARYIDAGMPEKSKIVGESRVAALPGEASLVSGWYLVMFDTCKEKDAAWEFMKFCVDPAIQKEVIERGGDCNPTHLDVLNDPELQEKYEVLRAVKDSFDKTKIYCHVTQYQTIKTSIGKYVELAVNGRMDPQEALDACAEELTQALIDSGELTA